MIKKEWVLGIYSLYKDDVMYVTWFFFDYYSVISDNTHFVGAHFILPWISIWKLRLSFLFFMHRSLFMRYFLFSLCISIITSKVLPLICHGSSRYINQLFMTSLILKKRCYQCWLWWQICLLTRSFLLYTKNFMYYLQLFTVSEMWYCKCIQWVIKLAYCFAVFYHLWLSW